MRFIQYDDLPAYATRALPFLTEREAEHCLAIGLITRLQNGESIGQGAPYLALIEDDDGRVIETLVMTPPFNLVLSHLAPHARVLADEVMRLAAADAHMARLEPRGLFGPNEEAQRFAEHWRALTEQCARVDRNERIYRLERVIAPQGVAGQMRRIEEADRPILREWLRAFSAEALDNPDDLRADAEIDWRMRAASSGMYLWQDGATPVSLAGYGNPTPHGIRIGPVYTPPQARGHGYASALTAALSQSLLDSGRQFVFLFTDLANPTSNHIYQAIGYRPISDASEFQFVPGV